MDTRELAPRFEAYGDWRRRLGSRIDALADWLAEQDLSDARVEQRLRQVQERLRQDKLIVAFVAEFSRGKSELINAIFFADFGQRILPSAAGRTTMCPTELLFDAALPPSIRLLPIETRLQGAGIAEFRGYAEEWVSVPLDLSAADQMGEALARVSEVKRVPAALAARYGLHDEGTARVGDDGTLEVPRWRHAIVNFPHPLLQQGLVILDTPGLNAIGIEPDLTLDLLPEAHAVLFIVAADAGVTRTDLDVWTQYLAGDDGTAAAGRIVVLNKIDGLWDDLKRTAAVDDEIRRQVEASAAVLRVPQEQVFAVSAQKALVAKINGDDALLERSRLPALERALSDSLLPARREIVGGAIEAEVRGLAAGVRSTLALRRAGTAEQIAELRGLRGKNQDVVDHMMARVRDEKAAFERGLQRYTALRTVLTDQSTRLYDCIGLDALRRTAERTRREIEASPFTKGIRAAMSELFATIRGDFARAEAQSAEIQEMMQAMYAGFAAEHGLLRFVPPPFSMLKYQREIARLERAYNAQFNTLWNMVSRAKFVLVQRFFETIASRVRHVYDIANRDVESWLRALMAPLESQVRERHLLLRRRLDSIKRIRGTSGELELRIAEMEQADAALRSQLDALESALAAIDSAVREPDIPQLAANG